MTFFAPQLSLCLLNRIKQIQIGKFLLVIVSFGATYEKNCLLKHFWTAGYLNFGCDQITSLIKMIQKVVIECPFEICYML